jgi:truncated hemoglobin YjbI
MLGGERALALVIYWNGMRKGRGRRLTAFITENNRIHLVLFGIQNRAFDPYLTAMHRILTSVMVVARARQVRRGLPLLLARAAPLLPGDVP